MLETRAPSVGRSLLSALLPIMATVVVVFLITGATLPALPLFVHDQLHYDAFAVGLVAAAQFAAALASRFAAGSFSDRRGPKAAVVTGLVLGSAGGVFYLGSLLNAATPGLSMILLLAGRALMGGAESFVITGAQSWGLNLAGTEASGRVLGWMGTAMYVALAVGAPIGSLLFNRFGFVAIGLMTLIVPIVAGALVFPVKGVALVPQKAGAIWAVARAVALPGAGLAFASLAYGVMTAFAVLYFSQQAWEPAWFSFTAYAIAFILSRLTMGSLPDRLGGANAALVFVLIEVVGMATIGLAPNAVVGFIGAFITGVGYSMVYPGLGREAIRRAPAQSRGLAMGIYTAFLDVALGILTPLLGGLATATSLGSVFVVSAMLAVGTAPTAMRLRR